MRPKKAKAAPAAEPEVHYRILFHEENPDLITIEKRENGAYACQYAYNASELGGTGACNCDQFYRRVYFKRRQMLTDSIQKHGARVTLARLETIKQASGSCLHEAMADICYNMTDLTQQELERQTGEERWRPTTVILVASVLQQMHADLGLRCCSHHDALWVKNGLAALIKGLRDRGPNAATPAWAWANKTILNRGATAAVASLSQALADGTKTLEQSFDGAIGYLTARLETSSSAPRQILKEFFEQHYPWLPESYKEAITYAMTKELPEDGPLTLIERETLTRKGGASEKMASLKTK